MSGALAVENPGERSRLCEAVLRSRPETFGTEEATAGSIGEVADLPTSASGCP